MRESSAMPGSIPSMAVQKKQSVVPPSQGPLSTSTIDSQRVGHRPEGIQENGSYFKPSPPQTKKTTCSANKSIQICNATLRVSAAGNGLNVDERLKAARERREEQQKLLVSRELSRLEREQRARRYYEQQLQERRKKLLEQRLKEERRRAAVEEKRKQRLREEKERHETAVRRTIERSQKAQQQLSQSSRGRKLVKNAPRRLPLSTWERNLVSRLLTPTCSYLARSKSAACRSGEEAQVVHVCRRAASCQPTAAIPSSAIITPKLRHQSVSVHRRSPASPSSANSQQRHVSPAQIQKVRQEAMKKTPNSSSAKRSSAAAVSSMKSPTCTQSRTASPSPERSPRRSISRHSTPLHLELPAVPEEDAAVYFSAGNTRPVNAPNKGQQQTQRRENLTETPRLKLPDAQVDGSTGTAADGNPQPAEVMLRPLAGTTDPKEASRLLAEKRREARMQREKEEQERLQREEAERRSREEQQRRRAEEQARQEAEARRLVEEKRRREEEEQRRAEEERAQAMREAELLQKQREEELAKERARAEQMKQEREIAAQKEEAERQARKKRLEEIMRRTRRTDSPDTKSVSARTVPKENTQPPHNGTIEDAAKTPVGTKTAAQLGLGNEDDVVPVVAFKERRSLRALSGLEEIQTKQRAEVI
ncbi:PREDICTED: ensconsin-like isoform X1 [Poecilia mexicana]|uniref:ensconsin-like isoform X1 n=1 Tax=Poecilia mexicana TaxID=48701 RepID=UPI00072E6F66|nr:PREDICTED: ensconsin-like isoform X1 [Poecilia mexicana]XP_014824444.1 PREDICTED: ensconsin-like isoform X1 [Poecilia mexicana]